MSNRYPAYDVMAKRDTPSWNDATRQVIDVRLAIVDAPKFLDQREWLTLRALADGIVPQRASQSAQVPIAAMVDRKLAEDHRDGYRDARLPPLRLSLVSPEVPLPISFKPATGRRRSTGSAPERM